VAAKRRTSLKSFWPKWLLTPCHDQFHPSRLRPDRVRPATLDEDLGDGLPGGGHDVTSESVIPADARFSGVMDSRDAITVAGCRLPPPSSARSIPAMEIDMLVEEGARCPRTDLMRLSGNARAMLTAERSALNTVQHLSGIATLTRQYVDAMAGQSHPARYPQDHPRPAPPGKVRHPDGRRAEPPHGAVGRGDDQGQPRAGCRRRGEAVRRAREPGWRTSSARWTGSTRSNPRWPQGPSHLLLDNMTVAELREAVALVAGRVPCEASGGVRLDTIGAIAATGVITSRSAG
jgi:nicotinate-nucleotide pyrophosphorylase (carboxylating)